MGAKLHLELDTGVSLWKGQNGANLQKDKLEQSQSVKRQAKLVNPWKNQAKKCPSVGEKKNDREKNFGLKLVLGNLFPSIKFNSSRCAKANKILHRLESR